MDLQTHDQWEEDWEGSVKASVAHEDNKNVMSAAKAWDHIF
jgi:hypothetical protein